MIGDGPAVKLRHPALDQLPRARIRAQAGLGQQFGGTDAGFEDIGLPELVGEGDALCHAERLAPAFRQVVQRRVGDAQHLAGLLVIARLPLGAAGLDPGAQGGKGVVQSHPPIRP